MRLGGVQGGGVQRGYRLFPGDDGVSHFSPGTRRRKSTLLVCPRMAASSGKSGWPHCSATRCLLPVGSGPSSLDDDQTYRSWSPLSSTLSSGRWKTWLAPSGRAFVWARIHGELSEKRGPTPFREPMSATTCRLSRFQSIMPPGSTDHQRRSRVEPRRRTPRHGSFEYEGLVCNIIAYVTQLPGGIARTENQHRYTAHRVDGSNALVLPPPHD